MKGRACGGGAEDKQKGPRAMWLAKEKCSVADVRRRAGGRDQSLAWCPPAHLQLSCLWVHTAHGSRVGVHQSRPQLSCS